MELILQLPWHKIPREQWETTMGEISSWGAKKLVAPQYFHHPGDKDEGGFVGKVSHMAAKYGMKIGAAHALLGLENDLGYASPKAIQEHTRYLRDLGRLGVSTYTAHSGAHHEGPALPREAFWTRFAKSIETLLPVLEETHITMALENIYEPLPLLMRMVKTVLSFNHPHLGFCLDSGHAHISGNGLFNLLDLFAPAMVTCHLHDNDGKRDLHAAPGTGTIDWEILKRKLRPLPFLKQMETESKPYSRAIWDDYNRLLGFRTSSSASAAVGPAAS